MKALLKSIAVFTFSYLLFPHQAKAQWSISGTSIYNNVASSNVGISNGSAFTPTERLQLKNGNFLLDAGFSQYFGGKTDFLQNGMRFSYINASNGYIDLRVPNLTSNLGLIFRVDANNGGTERMRINADGNIGINCSSPAEKLQINNGIFKLAGPTSGGGPMIFFNGSTSSAYSGDWSIEYRPSSMGNPGLNFWKPFGGPNWGNNYLFLSDNTNIGINTDNPTARLTVNGNVLIGDPAVVCIPNTNYKLFVQTGILTEKVKVAVNCSTDWADYVFDDTYKLKTINELEAFVKTNKHLPNVPSAEQVVKDGIDMATMDAKLLEKIEELSLYIIELKKENTELAKRVEKIENK